MDTNPKNHPRWSEQEQRILTYEEHQKRTSPPTSSSSLVMRLRDPRWWAEVEGGHPMRPALTTAERRALADLVEAARVLVRIQGSDGYRAWEAYHDAREALARLDGAK